MILLIGNVMRKKPVKYLLEIYLMMYVGALGHLTFNLCGDWESSRMEQERAMGLSYESM